MNQTLKKQEGAVLVFSLLILLVMTILGISTMQTSALEEKMSGNYRDRGMAFQAGEIALRNGERWLSTLSEEPAFASSGDHVDKVWSEAALVSVTGSSSWWTQDSWFGQDVDNVGLVAAKPERVLEYVKYVNDGGSLTVGLKASNLGRVIYRVTGRGTGGTDTATTILQSVYAKRF